MIKRREYSYTCDRDGRVDSVVSEGLGISRSVFSNPTLALFVNEKKTKKSSKVKAGDKVSISYDEDVLEGLEKEEIKLNIIYEDDDILVIDKEQGMAVHPGAGNWHGTVANALLGLYGEDFETGDDELRPGIVHRLDKDTSGVMVIAKNQKAHLALCQMFSEHRNEKYYIAICKGFFAQTQGTIESRIVRDRKNRKKFTTTNNKSEGRDALTKYSVVTQNGEYALLKIRIYTGRTHQIRVHLASIGHPIIGDPIYGRKDKKLPDATLMLHSQRLVITHPATGETSVFRAKVPGRFIDALKALDLHCDDLSIN